MLFSLKLQNLSTALSEDFTFLEVEITWYDMYRGGQGGRKPITYVWAVLELLFLFFRIVY